MTGPDIALCVIMLIGVYSGYRAGFLMSLFSLLAIVLGILGGFKLMDWAMALLAQKFDINQKILPYIAFGAVFIAILIAVRLLGNLIKVSIDRTFLGRIDQVAGGFLGLLKTVFLLSVVFWILEALQPERVEQWISGSNLLPWIVPFAPRVSSWVAEIFPVFKDVF